MAISVERVLAISRGVLAGRSLDARGVTVVASRGGSDRVEVLVSITGAHGERRLLLNLPRSDGAGLATDLGEKLDAVLRTPFNG